MKAAKRSFPDRHFDARTPVLKYSKREKWPTTTSSHPPASNWKECGVNSSNASAHGVIGASYLDVHSRSFEIDPVELGRDDPRWRRWRDRAFHTTGVKTGVRAVAGTQEGEAVRMITLGDPETVPDSAVELAYALVRTVGAAEARDLIVHGIRSAPNDRSDVVDGWVALAAGMDVLARATRH
ncbi:hypothetical protein [Sphingomonas sp. Ag1]|uniref:hypothetical protein n=1 Tax=Sphingomonas sp. Ag1 TaxID=1642949 RepID=UPI001E3E477C|nr:hypothetical protein [Sphingomonas sp. Ag1]